MAKVLVNYAQNLAVTVLYVPISRDVMGGGLASERPLAESSLPEGGVLRIERKWGAGGWGGRRSRVVMTLSLKWPGGQI